MVQTFIQISKRSQPHIMSTDAQGSIVCQHVKPTVWTQCAAQTPHHTQNIGTPASHLVILKQHSLLSTILPRPTQTLQFNSNGTACACISSRLSLVPLTHTRIHPICTYQTGPQSRHNKPRGNHCVNHWVSTLSNSPVKMLQRLWWQQLPIPNLWGESKYRFV